MFRRLSKIDRSAPSSIGGEPGTFACFAPENLAWSRSLSPTQPHGVSNVMADTFTAVVIEDEAGSELGDELKVVDSSIS